MPRKRILQLLHGLNTGGAEILADRLGRRLSDIYDVSFACLDNVGEIGEQLIASGYRVEQLQRGAGIDFGCVRRLASVVRDQRIDLIHAHQYTPFFYAMASRMLRAGQPILFTEHGRFLPDYPRRKRMLFNRTMLRRKDRLVAVGNDVKRALVENEGLPTERIDVIYNGIPVAAFDPDRFPDASCQLRQEIGLPPDAVVAVQVARLDYLKDHCTAIRAIAKAAESSDIHLVVVGEGPERQKMEQEIRELKICEHVHLLGLRQDVPKVLAGADILLLTSISEGIPLTLIEGMAARLPIVSTDVGGVSEIVGDQVHGFLCPAKDSDALAERLVRLGNDPTLREQMGLAGCKEACGRFSEKMMHDQYERTIASMVGNE